MCLGIPGRVIEMVDGYHDQVALVDVVGAQRKVNVGMLDRAVVPGEWIMLHLGFAVEIVEAAEAERALAGLEMMGRPMQGSNDPR
jgi:hydrogenase assembly chaperone HypC/HupF